MQATYRLELVEIPCAAGKVGFFETFGKVWKAE